MTCIIGYVDDSGVGWIGADSYQDNGVIKSTISGKAWRAMDGRGKYALVGTSGRSMFRPIVKDVFSIPFTTDPVGYILNDLPQAIKDAAQDRGFAIVESELVTLPDCDLMIVYAGKIYYMDSGFYIRESSRYYHAIGSGCVAAMGAMFAVSALYAPFAKLTTALDAAQNLTAYVCPPFEIIRDRDDE